MNKNQIKSVGIIVFFIIATGTVAAGNWFVTMSLLGHVFCTLFFGCSMVSFSMFLPHVISEEVDMGAPYDDGNSIL